MSRWRLELSRRRAPLACALDAQGLAWRPTAASAIATAADPAAGLAQRLQGVRPGATVDVIAASDIAVHWLQAPPAAIGSLGELRLVAQARCAQLFGGNAHGWWVGADWDARRPFTCAGLPAVAVQSLQAEASRHRAHLRWHTAWSLWCSAHAAQVPNNGWSALRTPARVMLWHCRGGRVSALAGLMLAPGTSPAQARERARQQIRIENLHQAQDASDELHWNELAPAQDGEAQREAHTALALYPWIGAAA